MESYHNPDRFMADLRQILSQGRKRIGLLVGAGAPLAIRVNAAHAVDPTGHPLIPGLEDLTGAVLANLAPEQQTAIKTILDDLGSNKNIEALLSKIRLFEQALGVNKVNGFRGANAACDGRHRPYAL